MIEHFLSSDVLSALEIIRFHLSPIGYTKLEISAAQVDSAKQGK